MTSPSAALLWTLAALTACFLLLVLRRPAAALLRLLGRSAVGLAALALLDRLGGLVGIGLGVNPLNALVLGLLGVPGFGLLLMLQWLLK